jgi:hypothetical protein
VGVDVMLKNQAIQGQNVLCSLIFLEFSENAEVERKTA